MHRLGFDYRKPKGLPAKAEAAAQEAFVAYYNKLQNRLEPDETSWHAAVRELREETGLEVQVHKLAISLSYSLLDDPPAIRARYAPGIETVTVHAFVADAPEGWEPTLDAEHDLYRWCDLDAALELMKYDTARDALRAGATAP